MGSVFSSVICLPSRAGRRTRGFTSVEFFATAVIMAILTTFAFAGYRVYQRQMPVKYTSQRLVHAFSAARAYAISNNATFSVQLDPDNRNFWIDQTDDNGAPIVHKVIEPEAIDEKVDYDGFQFASATPPTTGTQRLTIPVRFFADGSSDDVHVFFRMKADNSATSTSIFTVRLYGPTGQAHLFENQRL